ncbi:MAG: acyl carrier protein [Clostridia bacterium]|nr:acyl carrier protein [Clostridia bacterium]
MTREMIIEKLKNIFALVSGGSNVEVEEKTDLRTGLGLNSIGMLYMIIAIEENFSIRFENVAMGDFNTVADVIDYIEEQKQ